MRLFGLIGYPLEHSFSANYFRDKFQREMIRDCMYSNYPLRHISDLPGLLESIPGLCGLNVTIPFKKLVVNYLDEKRMPPELDACNCIHIQDGKLTGYNTDWIAFRESLFPLLKTHHTSALVLGTGGSAEAIRYALGQLGISISIVSRHNTKDSTYTYDELNKQIIQDHTIIINTTPLGMYPLVNAWPQIPYEFIGPKHILYDLVYNPARTLFLTKGKERGAVTKNGEDMLVLQAEESWRIWNAV